MNSGGVEQPTAKTNTFWRLGHFAWRLALLMFCVEMSLPSAMARASDKAEGFFLVNRACPALQSFRKGTNPGQQMVRPGQRYALVEVNDAGNVAWVRVRLGGEPRWVAAECGAIDNRQPDTASPPAASGNCRTPEAYDSFVLALTWQPGFCEHFPYRGRKPECQAMAEGRLDISHLTLHGLWPNKAGCGKDYGHCPGDDLALSATTIAAIRQWLPNAQFETTFAGYQWNKHGRCQQQLDDDGYFRLAVDYVKLVNDSPLGAYIAANIGGSIEQERFYQLVAETLGEAAKPRVQLLCSGAYLQEIRIRLPRELRSAATLAELIAGGPATAMPDDAAQCRGERIAIENSGP